jgi:hypothetical protein
MLVFPQLVTGAVALYPVTRQSVLRTVVNTLADGRGSRRTSGIRLRRCSTRLAGNGRHSRCWIRREICSPTANC